LAVLRDFSGILSHSLCAGALLKQFLLQLREILGVNRAAIFLRSSPGAPGTSPASPPDRRLHAAYAIGIAPGLLEHFELSLEAGIGGYVFRQGRILKSEASEASGDREIQKEFELLGAQVAIPILDRESLVGVAVFDGRLTGEPFANEELSLVFLLLEQLGLAIKNIWLHDQLAAHNEMVVDILSQLGNGCVVVGRNLEMFHANRVAQALFARPEGGAGPLEFSDLPQALGSKIFEVLQTGQGVPPFKYRPAGDAETVYQLTITPFKRRNSNLPNAVLLLIEDVTQIERNQRLEIESANLRLVKTMAEHLAHEIGNALVPISTHQQLLAQRLDDLEFRASLSQVMASGVRRISRLVRQMLYLASDTIARNDSIPVKQLVEDAFAEAQASFPEKTACLRLEDGAESFLISGDRTALKHALSEILINSFQANPANPKALVRLQRRTNGVGTAWLCIEVEDAGPGFTPKAVRKAQEPFFSTRNVGLGLGLAVTRKILEAHQGKLETPLTPVGQHGIVRITLPLTSQPGGNP
jgi:signal transduction histidine kinase